MRLTACVPSATDQRDFSMSRTRTAKSQTRRSKGRPRSDGGISSDPREDILRAASRLFSKQGISGTTIGEIADAVGIKQPSVYYHFKDKQDICRILVEYVVHESVAFAAAVVKEHESPSHALYQLIRYHVQRLTTGPYDLWFVVFESNRSLDAPSASRESEQWRRAVARLVKEGVAKGEFLPVRRQVAIQMASSLVHGALALAHRGVRVDPDEVAAMFLRLLGQQDIPGDE